MIVEDEAIIAADLKARVKGLGYSVCASSSSGEEAIQLAELEHPDLIIMDIVLDGEMDGIEAAHQIRTRLNIPIIFLTAYADEGRISRAKLTLPFGYLLKPFKDRDLKVAIEMALYVAQVDEDRKQVEAALRESES